MRFLIIALLIQMASTIFASDVENTKLISSALGAIGYSPVCVASALATCGLSTKNDLSTNVADLFDVTKELLQKLQKIALNSSSLESKTVITTFLNEIEKMFQENSLNITESLAKVFTILYEVKISGENTVASFVKINQELHEKLSLMSEFNNSLARIENSLKNAERHTFTAKNCAELRHLGDVTSGVRTVYPYGIFNESPMRAVTVYCDQVTDGGGWTVFQNRDALPTRENFYRTWNDYTLGFGDVAGEYWLGLDNIHELVKSKNMELRVDLENFEGVRRWAKYGTFYLGNASSQYTLAVGNYSGDAGDSLIQWHNGMKFSTHDQDNDLDEGSCAITYRGAWWYKNCHASNLNGFQYIESYSTYADGIDWSSFTGHHYSLNKTSMKIR